MLGAYACSTITVICSTFKRVIGIDAASDVISRPCSRDSSAFKFILSIMPIRSWSRDLKKGLDNNTDDLSCGEISHRRFFIGEHRGPPGGLFWSDFEKNISVKQNPKVA